LIRKCGSERKGFDTDFFQSLYSNRLINQVARSLELGFPVILQVAGSLNYLNGPNSKAYSTFASESTGMGMPVIAYPNAAVLCHGFVRYCLVEVHHQYPKFHLMPNDVNRFDTQLVMQLKQFPGFGDEKAEKVGNRYKGPLSLAGVTIPTGDKLKGVMEDAMWRISDDLREGKVLKKDPKKVLKIVENLVKWLFEQEVDLDGKKQE
jgi:ERCC4-type nuclease